MTSYFPAASVPPQTGCEHPTQVTSCSRVTTLVPATGSPSGPVLTVTSGHPNVPVTYPHVFCCVLHPDPPNKALAHGSPCSLLMACSDSVSPEPAKTNTFCFPVPALWPLLWLYLSVHLRKGHGTVRVDKRLPMSRWDKSFPRATQGCLSLHQCPLTVHSGLLCPSVPDVVL